MYKNCPQVNSVKTTICKECNAVFSTIEYNNNGKKETFSKQKLYSLTTFEKLDSFKKTNLLDMGDKRCVGIFSQLKNAQEIVEENICDIYEGYYQFAIIEEITTGLYPYCETRYLYKFDDSQQKYILVSPDSEEEKKIKDYTAFSIG